MLLFKKKFQSILFEDEQPKKHYQVEEGTINWKLLVKV